MSAARRLDQSDDLPESSEHYSGLILEALLATAERCPAQECPPALAEVRHQHAFQADSNLAVPEMRVCKSGPAEAVLRPAQ